MTLEITSGQVYRGKLIEGTSSIALHKPLWQPMLPGFIGFDQCTLQLFRLANTMLLLAEDNMNVQLKDITVTARDGRVSHLDQVYIRGSHVRFFIVPDMLRYVQPSFPVSNRHRPGQQAGTSSVKEEC